LTLSDYSFDLPEELIAQEPPAVRGHSRLLALDRQSGSLADCRFPELATLLSPGDLLVVNETKVFAARLLGRRPPGGGAAECLLVRPLERHGDGELWDALVHPGQRLKEGSRMEFGEAPWRVHAEIRQRRFHGRRAVWLWTDGPPLAAAIDAIGHVPLPPYIHRADAADDRERYQTVYARTRGSIAAPTAGLHFTPEILAALDARGVERTAVTLHVGYGTFQPIRTEDIEAHRMEPEAFEVPPDAAAAIGRARRAGRRVVAVGTTTTRTLESLSISPEGDVLPGAGETSLFIRPGHQFRVVSGLLTNFHLPRSSLLLLVCAFATREQVLGAYQHAIRHRYRFYSYGDAMLVR
jgi:S-adenosylmethionine:tRNA ribosyltransferase-isomerase